MHGARRLLRAWDRKELPAKAWPFTPLVMRAVAGTLVGLGFQAMGLLTVVMFHCLLRTSEGLNLRREQVTFDEGQDHAVLVLRETKTGKRLNVVESVTVECPIVCGMLRQLCRGKLPGDRLLPDSPASYRKQFKKALKVLYLDEGLYSPYSLRRGGATFDFRSHGRIEKTLIRGRWASTRSARIYITEGLASIAQLETTARQAQLIKVASRLLRPAGDG